MEYKKTIGIEVHCELKNKEKIFSPSLSNYGEIANTNANIIDMAYPGVLPQLNKDVLSYAIKACHVLNLKITKRMHFDRKTIFMQIIPKTFRLPKMKLQLVLMAMSR